MACTNVTRPFQAAIGVVAKITSIALKKIFQKYIYTPRTEDRGGDCNLVEEYARLVHKAH